MITKIELVITVIVVLALIVWLLVRLIKEPRSKHQRDDITSRGEWKGDDK